MAVRLLSVISVSTFECRRGQRGRKTAAPSHVRGSCGPYTRPVSRPICWAKLCIKWLALLLLPHPGDSISNIGSLVSQLILFPSQSACRLTPHPRLMSLPTMRTAEVSTLSVFSCIPGLILTYSQQKAICVDWTSGQTCQG